MHSSSTDLFRFRIISVSGHRIHLISKIRQTVAGISMANQFHEFFNIFVGGFSVVSTINPIFMIFGTTFFWTVIAGIKSNWLVLHNFRFRSLHALRMQNSSNCCRHKYDESISRIVQYNFWRFFCCFNNKPNLYDFWDDIFLDSNCLSQIPLTGLD